MWRANKKKRVSVLVGVVLAGGIIFCGLEKRFVTAEEVPKDSAEVISSAREPSGHSENKKLLEENQLLRQENFLLRKKLRRLLRCPQEYSQIKQEKTSDLLKENDKEEKGKASAQHLLNIQQIVGAENEDIGRDIATNKKSKRRKDFYKNEGLVEKLRQAYLKLAAAYIRLNLYAEAIDVYEELLNLCPGEERLHYRLGLLYYSLYDFKKASYHLKLYLHQTGSVKNKKEALYFLKMMEQNLQTGRYANDVKDVLITAGEEKK